MSTRSRSSDTAVRPASHAGSWYTANQQQLAQQLQQWLNAADAHVEPLSSAGGSVSAIICPHAGYAYSGPTAAYSYINLHHRLQQHQTQPVRRIFVLGPSHTTYTTQCEVTAFDAYDTVFGRLQVDQAVRDELLQHPTIAFSSLKSKTDVAEHSLEMQLPYISYLLQQHRLQDQITIVPIMVGSLSSKDEAAYGSVLASYITADDTFFCLSSDFCHWGQRFSYTYGSEQAPHIYRAIEQLDYDGMLAIAQSTANKSATNFRQYMKQTGNTICGRHPIALYVNAISQLPSPVQCSVEYLSYNQSSPVQRKTDSSVSYVAGRVLRTNGSSSSGGQSQSVTDFQRLPRALVPASLDDEED